jgi:hypothetical protein
MYFEYQKIVPLREDDVQFAKRYIDKYLKSNPDYDLKYIEGYCPYTFD